MSFKLMIAITLAVGCAHPTYADVTVYEPFNYASAGNVAGNGGSGSFGFSDNWNGDDSFGLDVGSLAASVPFPASVGNRVTADAFGGNRNVVRSLLRPLGADATTTYISFLMQAEDVVGEGAFNGWFSFTLRSDVQNLTVGKESFSNKYKVEGTFGQIALSDVDVEANQVHLFVLRADFLSGADMFRLYLDPATGQAEPLVADAMLSAFDLGSVVMVGLDGPGAFGFDELRIGSTWQDVALAPEASSLLLAGIGAAYGLFVHRR